MILPLTQGYALTLADTIAYMIDSVEKSMENDKPINRGDTYPRT